MVYFVKKREWEGSSVTYREARPNLVANRVISSALVRVASFFQNAWCQEKCLPRGAVLALGPFRGTAPRGGHSALPRGESGVRRVETKIAQSREDLGAAEGALHECAETRAFRAGGARSRGQPLPRDSTRPRPLPAAVRPQQSPMRFSNIMSL
jgi:hypothetical protein